ncbi:MAG: IS1595 family transposase [Alphaproteobacteria bacterium]
MTNLTNPIFTDETKAREYFEALHWPNGPVCPHCGETEKVYRLNGQSHRPGLVHCNGCNEAFTVTVGTVMESSHIPLHKWALGFRLMASSKKGISAHQLHRSLGIGYKAAWFMAHRIREAMPPASDAPKLGGGGKTVEADETAITNSRKTKRGPGRKKPKMHVLSLIERDGRTLSMPLDEGTVRRALYRHIDEASRLVTDKAQHYMFPPMAKHESVDHSKGEYVRGDVHTNTAEGYFSLFKRGLIGTYQHIGEQHLPRYLAEFDFRQNNRVRLGVDDEMRTARAVKGAKGKRLTYQQSDETGLA